MNKENKAFSVRPAYRVGTVQEYYFSKKLKEVAAMNAAGKRVISLGIGSPDLPPSEVAIETFQREVARPDVHGYQPYTGMPELRRGYAAWYEQWYGVAGCGPRGTAAHRVERGHPARLYGLPQPRRRRLGAQPGIPDL